MRGGGRPPRIHASPETDDEWLARLEASWPGVDIRAQLSKAQRKRGGDVERGWFEASWLPSVTPNAPLMSGQRPARQDTALPEPAGWRELVPSDYPLIDQEWTSIPVGGRQNIIALVKSRKGAA